MLANYPLLLPMLQLSTSKVQIPHQNFSHQNNINLLCSKKFSSRLIVYVTFPSYSFHLGVGVDGSGCSSSSSYIATLTLCEELIGYGAEIGYEFTVIDIRGGYSGHLHLLKGVEELSPSINARVDEIVRKYPHISKVIAEPGMV